MSSSVNLTNYPNTYNALDRINADTFYRLPYDKVPEGGVVQVAHNLVLRNTEGGINEAETSSSSFQSTYLSATINPKFRNSTFIIQMAFAGKSSGSAAYHQFDLRRSISGLAAVSVNQSNTNGIARVNGETTSIGAHYYETNLIYIDSPKTLGPITYTLYHRVTNGGYVVRVGENAHRQSMIVWEIRNNDT